MENRRHKMLVSLIALLWLPLLAVAQQSNTSNIEAFAQKHWCEGDNVQKSYSLKRIVQNIKDLPCYVIERIDEVRKDTLPGYVIIAEQGNSTTLLAFDDKSKFTTTNLPPHIKSWINKYGRIDIENNKDDLREWIRASQTNYNDVAPLLGKKEWGQDSPYNLLCPTIDGKRCPAGCVATALSQIMSYHKWPLSGTGKTSYTTATNKIEINYDFANTIFEWDKMLDAYIPLDDLSSQDDAIVSDNQYFLNSIGIDNNSIASSKCYISISGLTIMGKSYFEGEVVLMATDNNGNLISRVSSSSSIQTHSSGRILNNQSFLLCIPSDIPDATYRIYCAARSNDTSEWSLSNAREKDSFISLSKEGEIFSVGESTFPCCPSTENVTPVSTLLQAVGAAVRMDYKLSSSGSNDTYALEGLVKYLKYDSDMFFAYPDTYTDEQWHEILQQELVEGRPVYYTGQGIEFGHAFIIDGFKKADDGTTYYHINWGWDGLCNGYYLLNMLRPSSTGTGGSSGSNYADQPSMLIGMKPEDGISTIKMNCSSIDLLENEFIVGDFLPARIRTLSLQTSKDFTGNLQLQLQSEDSTQSPIVLYDTNCTIMSKRGLTNYIVSCQIPTDIKKGDYTLKIACTTNDGKNVEIKCREWPIINIKDSNEWYGGSFTQPIKKLAIGGTLDLQTQEDNGIVTLVVDSIVNPMPNSTTGHLALVICDESGKMLKESSDNSLVSLGGYNLRKNINVSLPISRNIPDGRYELKVGYLPQNELLWTYCDKIQSEGDVWWASFQPFAIPFSITDGKIYIQGLDVFEGADSPWVSNIHSITSDADCEDTVFDLSGRKTKTIQSGIYIMKRNNKLVKTIKRK